MVSGRDIAIGRILDRKNVTPYPTGNVVEEESDLPMERDTPQPAPKYKSYADIREDTRELLRRNLVEAANHLLMTKGPEALTVRRIAEKLNASTKVIYNLFGGKDGLANELYIEGCNRLRRGLEGVSEDQTVQDYIAAAAWAYWRFAEDNPGYYKVMFGNAIPHFRPEKKSLEAVAAAFKTLVGRFQKKGELSTADIEQTVNFVWASLHGVVGLYQSGHFSAEEGEALYAVTVDSIVTFLSTT